MTQSTEADETRCPGCINGPGCRVIPCAGCGTEWHILGSRGVQFTCWRCEASGEVSR
jgi:hypothetical protein